LNDPRFPYRYGHALWGYLTGQFGEDVVARALKSKASGGGIGPIADATGVDAATLTSAWHESIRRLTGVPTAPSNPTAAERPAMVIRSGRLTVGPALSPDGKSIAFFTDRDRHSLEVVLADAATGVVTRRLGAAAGDPHFDSLQFIDSVGAWEPSGRRFALAALSRGRPVLTLLDVATGAIDDEITIDGVDQVFNPTWSPDGRQIAFSALRNGSSDLYVLDVSTRVVSRLMADAYADLQPSWSPDGRTVAFATDRFSSSAETLTFGTVTLGLIDVTSRRITNLPAIPAAKNIDPHWSADGNSLYFVADVNNISNVYRLSIADGIVFQLTRVSTGVSGVTALSPAIAVAAYGNRLAFSVYWGRMRSDH
jgi:Tol biopolymer transport system component